MNENIKPVLGYGSNRIIGHWDEANDRFIPFPDKTILEEEAHLQLKNNTIYPLAVKITDSEINGSYVTYRTMAEKETNPKVIIYSQQDSDGKVITTIKYS
jgi:hypothetical protein